MLSEKLNIAIDFLKNVDSDNFLEIYNNYAESNSYEGIYRMCDIDEHVSVSCMSEALEILDDDFKYNDEFFTYDQNGNITSSNDIDKLMCDTDEAIAEYILDNPNILSSNARYELESELTDGFAEYAKEKEDEKLTEDEIDSVWVNADDDWDEIYNELVEEKEMLKE